MSMPATLLPTSVSLRQLLHGYADAPDLSVSGIASDSRQLRKGDLFLACAGADNHGLDYIEQARAAGVVAVAWDASTACAVPDVGVPMIAVDNLSLHLGEIANRFYGHPSAELATVGVTGTNGKTTVAWMIAQCLQHLGQKCGYVGTLGIGTDELQASGMTTPAALELHRSLADFVDHGATHAAIEVSSHALSQRRVDGVTFDAALFTNLTRDHLDYHSDIQEYFETKARLFFDYDAAVRIVDVDTEFGQQLANRCGADVVTVSTRINRIADSSAYVFVRPVAANELGSEVAVSSSWGEACFTLPMPGDFNVSNAALVLAYLLTRGIALQQACDVLEVIDAPPGRMQRVMAGGSDVYIDYAHTPDAIEAALLALRPHCRGKLWCVFGCGGDRDVGKRPQMGALAQRLADRVVVTSDNPRTEAPQQILDAIVAGFSAADAAVVIEDRAAAIAWAIAQADASDTVLIAGKGHEQYQDVGADRLPFSDYAVALAALEAREGAA